MEKHFFKCLLVLIIYFKLKSAQISPCPDYFLFEPDKSEDDKWYGIINLETTIDIVGVHLELHFDKPVIQLGNSFGKVAANSKNTIFAIKNPTKTIRANVPQKVEIYAVYDPYYDVPIPQLKKILFNGRVICPKKQQVAISQSVTVNINYSNCGTKIVKANELILNGRTTKEGEWPWHTALYRLEGQKKLYICGGTLISNRHILTAAHCTTIEGTTDPRDINRIAVTLGKYAMSVKSRHEQDLKIERIVVHPDFDRTNLHNDISIIVTVSPFQFNDYVKPVCLWKEDPDIITVINKLGTVVGWGRDENNNANTDLLMEAQMPVVSRLQCILTQGTYYTKFTNENTLCAGHRNSTASSVCNGDSGGGLIFPRNGTNGIDTVWQIRGIVSNTVSKEGNVCDPNYYVVFTDVAKYLNWIKTTMSQ